MARASKKCAHDSNIRIGDKAWAWSSGMSFDKMPLFLWANLKPQLLYQVHVDASSFDLIGTDHQLKTVCQTCTTCYSTRKRWSTEQFISAFQKCILLSEENVKRKEIKINKVSSIRIPRYLWCLIRFTRTRLVDAK